MTNDEQCRAAGPGEVECTRVDGHGGSHTAYPTVDGEMAHVEWFRCNPIGEPIDSEEAADD